MQTNLIHCGDATELLKTIPVESIDLVITDPPYLVNYSDRTGRSLANDDNPDGVLPAFDSIARAMKRNSYASCFCGWSALPGFSGTWQAAGLRIVSEIVWQKEYTSRRGYTRYRHESAYLLAKGNPAKPEHPISSVQPWTYSGNRQHPTEKAVEILAPLVRCFSKPGDLICDPFAGSGSSCVAAALNGREDLGIEIDATHCTTARARLAGVERYKTGVNTETAQVAA
ncbi:DNA methyltransferase [uncultured Roseobacter sp.]|uniref:DNA methyltransferase n=1 Tax=uncultured Roseobacter sp. TaxID=114847 RepID=UPI00262889BF|nr:DNA methyltransferase [uncultured Roseobacter sp.]